MRTVTNCNYLFQISLKIPIRLQIKNSQTALLCPMPKYDLFHSFIGPILLTTLNQSWIDKLRNKAFPSEHENVKCSVNSAVTRTVPWLGLFAELWQIRLLFILVYFRYRFKVKLQKCIKSVICITGNIIDIPKRVILFRVEFLGVSRLYCLKLYRAEWLTCCAKCDKWNNKRNFEFSFIFISITENEYAQIHPAKIYIIVN